jgi:hypothetical protein
VEEDKVVLHVVLQEEQDQLIQVEEEEVILEEMLHKEVEEQEVQESLS